MFQKIWGTKKVMHKKGITLFSVEFFLSHSADRFRGEPFNVSENLGFPKNLCIKRGYHYSPLNFLSLSAKKNLSFKKLWPLKMRTKKSNCSSMITITFLTRTALIYRNFFGYVKRRCTKKLRILFIKGNNGILTQNVLATSEDALPKCFARQ